LRDYEEDMEGY